MKKLFAPVLLFITFASNAQVYQKGSKFVNVGVGLSPGIGVIASADLGVHEYVSVGAFGAYQTWGLLGNNLNYGRIGVGGKADFHLGKLLKDNNVSLDVEKIDPYLGAQAGLGIWTGSFGSLYTNNIWPIIGGHAGVRYMMKPNMGFFGEVGYDVMYLKAGLTIKLGK